MPTPEPRYNPDDEGPPQCIDCDRETALTNRHGEPQCLACQDAADERAYERSLTSFYGSGTPQADAQRMDAAHKAKREE